MFLIVCGFPKYKDIQTIRIVYKMAAPSLHKDGWGKEEMVRLLTGVSFFF